MLAICWTKVHKRSYNGNNTIFNEWMGAADTEALGCLILSWSCCSTWAFETTLARSCDDTDKTDNVGEWNRAAQARGRRWCSFDVCAKVISGYKCLLQPAVLHQKFRHSHACWPTLWAVSLPPRNRRQWADCLFRWTSTSPPQQSGNLFVRHPVPKRVWRRLVFSILTEANVIEHDVQSGTISVWLKLLWGFWAACTSFSSTSRDFSSLGSERGDLTGWEKSVRWDWWKTCCWCRACFPGGIVGVFGAVTRKLSSAACKKTLKAGGKGSSRSTNRWRESHLRSVKGPRRREPFVGASWRCWTSHHFRVW